MYIRASKFVAYYANHFVVMNDAKPLNHKGQELSAACDLATPTFSI